MEDRTLGTLLAIAGVVLFVGMVVGSAALAPDRGVSGRERQRTLVGIQGGGAGLHKFGRVGLYAANGSLLWKTDAADSYFDVTRLEDGRVLAGFMSDGFGRCGPYDSPCSRTGFHVIDPSPQPRVVDRYSFPVRTKKNSEVHDVERLPSGNFLHTDMEYERIVIVTPGGRTVWQWNASSFYEAPADPTTVDWLHINDVDRIGAGRFLVSVRNANQLLVVERGEGVVGVVNEDAPGSPDASCRGRLIDADGDGDIRCGDPGVMSHQHNPQWLGEGAVLVADSGNNRVVELHYDRDQDRWMAAWMLYTANGIDLSWPRDADRLPNGHTLITDSANYRVIEVNRSGAVVWSLTMPRTRMPYEAERLPYGELVGAPIYNGTETTAAKDEPTIRLPGVTAAFETLRTSVSLPFWATQWHVLGAVVCLGLVFAGVGLRRRA